MAHPISTVDRLPESERTKILDAILAGETLSSLAVRLGISRQAMSSYKNRVIGPAMKTAAELADHRRRKRQTDTNTDNVSRETSQDQKQHAVDIIAENKVLTREIVKSSPVRERLESVWSKTTTMLDSADVDNGAPWANAATKQVELLARLTGELQDKSGPSLTLNIVCPATEAKRIDYSDSEAIEMGFDSK